MQYLFLAFAALALAAFAPPKVTLSVATVIVLVSLVVKVTATKLIGTVSITDAARSVGWAFVLLAAAIVGVLWASGGQLRVEGMAALLLVSGLFACFVLGFKMTLDASFGASAAIAVVSTVVSGVLLFLLKPILF